MAVLVVYEIATLVLRKRVFSTAADIARSLGAIQSKSRFSSNWMQFGKKFRQVKCVN